MNNNVFRAYDIRGIFEKDIDLSFAWKIGKAFAKLYLQKQDKIIVGYDARNSSQILFEGLIKGLNKYNNNVVSIGLAPTPMLYYASHELEAAAAIMITASHNPGNYNGFKIILNNKPFYGEKLEALRQEILKDSLDLKDASSEYNFTYIDIKNKYINRITQNLHISPHLKIAWDNGNGSAGEVLKKILKRLPNKNFLLYGDPDGNFPNHHPDPTIPSNLIDIVNFVKKHNCNFGVAFDGDGDRIGVVDSEGKIIWGDLLLCLFGADILKSNPSATIIADIKSSEAFINYINSLKGIPLLAKTGHVFIKQKMQETKALLGGEMSGHIFFADQYYGYDDGLYAALRLLDLVSRVNLPLSAMYNRLPKLFNTPEIRIAAKDEEKFALVNKIKEFLIKQGARFYDIDGIRVTNENGWWLLRASNTEPALILRCEGYTSEKLNFIMANVMEILNKHGVRIE